MKLIDKAVEIAVSKSAGIKQLFEVIKHTVQVLDTLTRHQVTAAESILAVTDSHETLQAVVMNIHEEQNALVEQHELLIARYSELCQKFEEQQATNADLYSLLLKLANAMKEKGIDPKFPKMEFESTTKKPTGGIN